MWILRFSAPVNNPVLTNMKSLVQKNKWRIFWRIDKSCRVNHNLGCFLSYLCTVFLPNYSMLKWCHKICSRCFHCFYKMICFWNITSNNPRYILSYFSSRGSFVPQGYYGPGCTFNTWRWCDFFASSLGQCLMYAHKQRKPTFRSFIAMKNKKKTAFFRNFVQFRLEIKVRKSSFFVSHEIWRQSIWP